MKELSTHIIDATEVHAVNPVKKELKFVGRIRPMRGQRVFELDLETRVINEATFDEEYVHFDCELVTRKLIIKENHLYCAALNAKNADKKFFKLLGLKYPKEKK